MGAKIKDGAGYQKVFAMVLYRAIALKTPNFALDATSF